MNKKKTLVIAIFAILLILILYFFFRKSDSSTNQLTVKVQRGNFTALVFSSGQLESEKSEMINIPEKLKDRNLRIWELAITDMIEEGTVVDSGDYVATLDHKAVEEQIKLAQDDMDKALTELEDSKIDSNLNLSNQRDVIVNSRLDLIEKKLVMEESVYESPSIQKKANMDYDKAVRKLDQEQKSYVLKKKQARAAAYFKFIGEENCKALEEYAIRNGTNLEQLIKETLIQMKVEFNYDKSQLTSIDELTVSVADLRDLVQAFTIGNDAQKIQELKMILESIVRKNRLLPGAVDVNGSD